MGILLEAERAWIDYRLPSSVTLAGIRYEYI